MIKNPSVLLPLCPLRPQGLAYVASGVPLWRRRMDGALTGELPGWGADAGAQGGQPHSVPQDQGLSGREGNWQSGRLSEEQGPSLCQSHCPSCCVPAPAWHPEARRGLSPRALRPQQALRLQHLGQRPQRDGAALPPLGGGGLQEGGPAAGEGFSIIHLLIRWMQST